MDCLYRTDYFFSLKAVTLMPLFMCLVLLVIWRRGVYVFKRKLALYPRRCTLCHHPLDPFEISPQERRIRLTLKREKNCCIRNYRLYKHILFATIKGKKYVYQLDPLDKALDHPGHKSKNMKLVKTINVKRAVSKLKGTKQGHVSKHKV